MRPNAIGRISSAIADTGCWSNEFDFTEDCCGLLEPLHANGAIGSNQAHLKEPPAVLADDHPGIIAGVGMSTGRSLFPDLAVVELEHGLAAPATKWWQNPGMKCIFVLQ